MAKPRNEEGDSLQEWQDILVSNGWKGTEERLRALCKFLVEEGLTWRMIGSLGDPAGWAPQFAANELQSLIALAENGRKIQR